MLDQPDDARRYARSSLKYFDAPRRAVGYEDFAWSCFCREQAPDPLYGTLARASGCAPNLLFTPDPNRRRMAPIGMGVPVTIALWTALALGGDIPGVTPLRPLPAAAGTSAPATLPGSDVKTPASAADAVQAPAQPPSDHS